MPPRIRARLQANQLRPGAPPTQYVCRQCRHASLATATTPAPPIDQTIHAARPIARYPATQPPSYKPPEFRKSQLHRSYQSVLRSSPLILIFQHNNLKSTEWTGIRRELAIGMEKVDEELAKNGTVEHVGRDTRIAVVQTGIFASALKVVEFWNPNFEPETKGQHPRDPQTATSANMKNMKAEALLTHGLSKKAYEYVKQRKHARHGLEPLLSGPLAILTVPSVSPQHLKAALSILSPSKQFPAPKRRTNPSYHEPAVQNGLQKLMLLGARVEGKAFDTEGAKWIGSIAGGLEGLRGQLVAMLSGVGAGITTTLEAASKSLYLTVEGRRTMLEEDEKLKEEKPKEESS